MVAIAIRDLAVRRSGREVVRIPSLEVPAGTVTGLTGPSGCGKTTLMRCIAGVQRIAAGEVNVLGAPLVASGLRAASDVLPLTYAHDSLHEIAAHGRAPRGRRPRALGLLLRALREDDPTTETLRLEQLQCEKAEREHAEQATTPAEERAADRRADKAAYLREKLDEQAEHPDDPA